MKKWLRKRRLRRKIGNRMINDFANKLMAALDYAEREQNSRILKVEIEIRK